MVCELGPWVPPVRALPGMSYREATQDTLEITSLVWPIGTPW